MTPIPQNSPTLADLQCYLIQLQEVLRHRQEAAAAHELATQELQSLEAQHQREVEIEKARLKADADRATAEAHVAYEQEEQQRRREHELKLEEQRVIQARISNDARIVAENLRAAAAQAARLDLVRNQSLRQIELDRERSLARIDAARTQVTGYLQVSSRYLKRFPMLRDELSSSIAKDATPERLFAVQESLERYSSFVRTLSELVDVLVAAGLPESEALEHIKPKSLDDLPSLFETISKLMDKAPAVGLETWQPLDRQGFALAPWQTEQAIAWKHRQSQIKLLILSHTVPYDDHSGADSAISYLHSTNSQRIANSDTWEIPGLAKVADLLRFQSSDFIGITALKRIWIKHADAPGRASAFDLTSHARQITGQNDRCSIILFS